MDLKMLAVDLKWREGCNIVIGQSHFIKTVEDISEIMAGYAPHAEYGLAFNEASDPRLVRTSGNSPELVNDAVRCALEVAAGHTFYLVLAKAFPINILNQIKNCQEVCTIFCATGNPLQVIVAESTQGRGIIGVIDGGSPLGVEKDEDRKSRHSLLRKFGYKF